MITSRFAPSPTGDLHIGGIRTALYAWLYARQQNGKFILRIEDTDQVRSTESSVTGILQGMSWIGLDFDEGPVFQSDRTARYKQAINTLLENGHAYKCYCSKKRLDKLREEQLANKQKPKYDGYCRNNIINSDNLDNNSYVVRFASPLSGETVFIDRVRGELKVCNIELDDLIIARSDGSPTYNLSVVVDDLDMGVTMVIRGDDHINNTYRQINIFKALGAKPPQFAHVSSILGQDGLKLSKRHGATSVIAYKDLGILPEALLNSLVRLGWAHGDQEIFSKQEMISLFKIDDVHKSPAVFDMQKLYWFNQQYIKNYDDSILADLLIEFLYKINKIKNNVDFSQEENKLKLINLVKLLKTRAKTLVEMAEEAACFYISDQDLNYNQEAIDKFINNNTKNYIKNLINIISNIDNNNWTSDNIKINFNNLLKELNIKMPELAQPVRIALTGDTQSPAINDTIYLMGKNKVINRLNLALDNF